MAMQGQILLVLAQVTCLVDGRALAQSDAEGDSAETGTADGVDEEGEDLLGATVFDTSPFGSARASGMGGAIGSSADDLDAAFHNPAGIGGLGWGKRGPAWVRKLWFPLVNLEANASSGALFGEARDAGAGDDGAVAAAVLDAHAGERQYGRGGFAVGLVLGRTMVVPFYDMQIAAVSHDNETDEVDVRCRVLAGGGAGFSAQTTDGTFALGYFGYGVSRTDVDTTLTYDQAVEPFDRADALKDGTNKTTGVAHNVGILWRLAKTGGPTLGVALTDAGGTHYKPSRDQDTEVLVPQDLSVSFGLTPTFGKSQTLVLAFEAGRLLDDEVAFTKKYHIGMDYSLWGRGSYAALALRGGYADAGGSGGLLLNLGLVGVEGAVHSVDIGVGNQRVIERRYVVTGFVNVADF